MARVMSGNVSLGGRVGKVLRQGSDAASSRRGRLPEHTCRRPGARVGCRAPPDTLREGAASSPRFLSASKSPLTKKKERSVPADVMLETRKKETKVERKVAAEQEQKGSDAATRPVHCPGGRAAPARGRDYGAVSDTAGGSR